MIAGARGDESLLIGVSRGRGLEKEGRGESNEALRGWLLFPFRPARDAGEEGWVEKKKK